MALALAGCEETVSFPSAKLTPTDEGPILTISGLLSRPAGNGPYPAVVLLHTCGGMNPHVTEDWPRFLNGLGYATFTVDSLGARGLSRCTRDLVENHRALTRDAYGALDYLAGQPFIDAKRIGVMGFSMGALTINYFAGRHITSPGGHGFRAAVSLYGGCYSIQRKPVFRTVPMPVDDRMIPLTVIVGANERDRLVSSCRVLDGTGRMRVHVLPGAYHAFDQRQITAIRSDQAGNPMLYNAAATDRAREIVRAFFAGHLGR
jgi:dienelactone hydrolase